MITQPAYEADSERRTTLKARSSGQQQTGRYPGQPRNFEFGKRKREKNSRDQRQSITLNLVPLHLNPFQRALTCMKPLALTNFSSLGQAPRHPSVPPRKGWFLL